MTDIYADIALPLPLPRVFTYRVRPEVSDLAVIGCRVLVPFGSKTLTGVVVDRPASTTVRNLKTVIDVLDDRPAFTGELLRLTKWTAEYYMASWGEVLKSAAPSAFSRETKLRVRLRVADPKVVLDRVRRSAPQQYRILLALARSGELGIGSLQKTTGIRHLHAVLRSLERNGMVEILHRLSSGVPAARTQRTVALSEELPAAALTAKQRQALEDLMQIQTSTPGPWAVTDVLLRGTASLSVLKALAAKGLVTLGTREVLRRPDEEEPGPPPSVTLNRHQQAALIELRKAIDHSAFSTFLLHGITGSGKTQVYIEALRHACNRGKSGIVLVPEISLTPQTVRRFRSHFGERVAVMHSQMSAGERHAAWRMARDGNVDVVIGPRSAVFAPLMNIGLIVVDEEHESSYKQYDAVPRYHARDVAIVRGSTTESVVLLGSATPSAESYQNALGGKYRLLELPDRIDAARLPDVTIVNMAQERARLRTEEARTPGRPAPGRPMTMVSGRLREAITQRLERHEGTILLQNRRGFSHVMECFDCGHVEKCAQCDVTLTYHSTKRHLRCHYCGRVKHPPSLCPSCSGRNLRFHAFGTQRIEEELSQLFPAARTIRMDLDTTARKGSHERLLRQFGEGTADILLGTQMVAKGLDFPHVTLVGVISADTQMLLPDFRSSERTFQLLTQVAGRAGRSVREGEVIIQTLQPEHYSLRYAQMHDVAGFYREELRYRRELSYPPFSRLVLVEFRGEKEAEVVEAARVCAAILLQQPEANAFAVLGPSEAAIPRLRGLFRHHVLIKDSKERDPSGHLVRSALGRMRDTFRQTRAALSRRVQITLDVDPQSLM